MQNFMQLIKTKWLICFLISSLELTKVNAHWWGYIAQPLIEAFESDTPVICSELHGLSRNQRTLCETYKDLMPYVGEGAKNGMEECEWQFKDQRWNCSTATNIELFKKIMKIGSKESAFTYAVAASAVVHAVARACKNGKVSQCGCSVHPRPAGLGRDWEWGGCGDNTEYAYGFAREFLDAKELDNVSPKDPKSKSRKLMNVHNNEAGRLAVVRSGHPACKCHGVSGSCSLKTCWMHVPELRRIGTRLKSAYVEAVEGKVSKRGQLKDRSQPSSAPPVSKLVYLDSSPDYCTPNSRMGVLGTTGRICTENSEAEDGCGRICCGRRHKTTIVEVIERCNCNFHWCCVVKCDKCKKKVKRHICT